jgi:hypothetical protein
MARRGLCLIAVLLVVAVAPVPAAAQGERAIVAWPSCNLSQNTGPGQPIYVECRANYIVRYPLFGRILWFHGWLWSYTDSFACWVGTTTHQAKIQNASTHTVLAAKGMYSSNGATFVMWTLGYWNDSVMPIVRPAWETVDEIPFDQHRCDKKRSTF